MSSFLENAALAVETDNHIDVNLNLFIEKLRSNQIGSTIDLQDMGWFRLLSIPSFKKLTDAILEMNNTNPNWKLVSLNLSNNYTVGTPAGMRVLSDLLKRSKNTWSLSTLRFTQNGINGEAFKELVDALVTRKEQGDKSPVFGSLRNLYLWDNSIGDQGLLEIYRLVETLPLLEQIHLKGNRGITKVGLEDLEEYLGTLRGKMSPLPTTKIDLSNTIKKGYYVVSVDTFINVEGVAGCKNDKDLAYDTLTPEEVVFRTNKRKINKEDPDSPFIEDCYTNFDVDSWFKGPPIKLRDANGKPFTWMEFYNLVDVIAGKNPFENIKQFKDAKETGRLVLNVTKENLVWVYLIPKFVKTHNLIMLQLLNNSFILSSQDLRLLDNVYNSLPRSLQFIDLLNFFDYQSLKKILFNQKSLIGLLLNFNDKESEFEIDDLLESLKVNPNLKYLSLCLDFINDVDVQNIINSLQESNASLNRLILSSNQIGDVGAKIIADFLRTSQRGLSEINLRNNKIGDLGSIAIAEAIRENNTKTELLFLGGNQIGASGISTLVEAFKVNKSFLWLDLGETEIGDTAAIELADSLLKDEIINFAKNFGVDEVFGDGKVNFTAILTQIDETFLKTIHIIHSDLVKIDDKYVNVSEIINEFRKINFDVNKRLFERYNLENIENLLNVKVISFHYTSKVYITLNYDLIMKLKK